METTWLDSLLDARPVRAVFGSAVPSLSPVVLHEVRLHRDGPRVLLRFDLPDFPAEPPRKWLAQQANVVQLELSLIGIVTFLLSGWSTDTAVDLSISTDGGLVRVAASGGPITLDIDAESAVITSISAYQNARTAQ
jgi:hypothetical protein